MNEKLNRLKNILKSYGSVAIAFSGGVDSTFLLKVACDVLGSGAFAIMVRSRLVPRGEIEEAISFCSQEGIRLEFIEHDETTVTGFSENPTNRCYICKKAIFTSILAMAKANHMNEVCEGSNVDDESDYRPGMKAIAELNIKSPLRAAGLTKKDIRELSRKFGLPTANKPSFACLASRIPYGEFITEQKLKLVESAEEILRKAGFTQYRVRCREIHEKPTTSGQLAASIEILPSEFPLFEEHQNAIINEISALGFTEVLFDKKGYRTGSLNTF